MLVDGRLGGDQAHKTIVKGTATETSTTCSKACGGQDVIRLLASSPRSYQW